MFSNPPSLCPCKVNPCNNKVSPGKSNPYTHINMVSHCKGKVRVKSYSSRPKIPMSKRNRLRILLFKGSKPKILMSKGNRFLILLFKGNRSKILMSKGNMFRILLFKGSRSKILKSKGNKCNTLLSRGNRSKTLMLRGIRCKIHMSKVHRLNNLLTHMLLISNLWLEGFKAFKVRILPTGKVTYSGGKIKCHMEKTLHYGAIILTSKDGFRRLGPLIGLKCLSIPNCHSWLH